MKNLIVILILFLLIGSTFPLISYAEEQIPSLESEAAVLIDAKTRHVIYEKNGNQKMYPASLTKIATAIVAIEEGNLDDIVTVSENARNVEGTRVYLEIGEQVPLLKLVQGLLINSGNDAGVAIAEHMDGSVDAFSTRMNKFFTKKLGITNTNFDNPHGLYSDNHFTTAHDFALITSYALENDIFREIFGTAELEWKGEGWDTIIYNHHQMLRERPYEGIVGGKNGYVQKSGHTLSTVAKREDITLIAVVLKANLKRVIYNDTAELLDYGFEHFQTSKLSSTKIFKDNKGRKYYPLQAIQYTHRLNEKTKQNVNDKGELVIKGEDGQVISTTKLQQIIEKKDEISVASVNLSNEKEPNESNSKVVVTVAAIFLIFTGVFLRILKKKRRYTN